MLTPCLLLELQEALRTYQSQAEAYRGRFEAAEIARTKSSRAEAAGEQPILFVFYGYLIRV